jgi:serine protease Do
LCRNPVFPSKLTKRILVFGGNGKMKTLLSIILVIVVIWSVIGGILLFETRGSLNTAQNDIASLKNDLSSLKGNVTSTPNPTSSAAVNQPTSNSIADLIVKFEPSAVRIDVSGRGFHASGSGVVVDSRGYVLTNQHVIDASTSINTTLKNGQQYSATIVASSQNPDLALLKLSSASDASFQAVDLGSSNDVFVGAEVLAMGFPLGTDLPGPASFTRGIISALRDMDGVQYIQTDVTINPGSSGGCLISFNGKLIGITTAAILPLNFDAENVGLAIPIDQVQKFLQTNLK